MTMPKFNIAVIVGSTREASINRRLAQALARLGAESLNARFVRIDDLPLYNQDLEGELPAAVARFKKEIDAADAVLFVTPEHSRSIPAALKNAIDWGARPWGRSSWAGKVAAIAGASPGAIGTALAQTHLRAILGHLGLVLLGGETYIRYSEGLVSDDNSISDDSTRKFLQGFVDQFASFVGKFVPAARAAA